MPTRSIALIIVPIVSISEKQKAAGTPLAVLLAFGLSVVVECTGNIIVIISVAMELVNVVGVVKLSVKY